MTYELKLPPKASLLPEPPEASDEFYVRLELFLSLSFENGGESLEQ